MNNKFPSAICFLDPNDRERIKWDDIAEDRKDPEYEADHDFNVDDYELVDETHDASDYGDRITEYYVKRKSDGRFFKLRIYDDSWSDAYRGWPGEYGEINEVIGKPVTKMEWTDV